MTELRVGRRGWPNLTVRRKFLPNKCNFGTEIEDLKSIDENVETFRAVRVTRLSPFVVHQTAITDFDPNKGRFIINANNRLFISYSSLLAGESARFHGCSKSSPVWQ